MHGALRIVGKLNRCRSESDGHWRKRTSVSEQSGLYVTYCVRQERLLISRDGSGSSRAPPVDGDRRQERTLANRCYASARSVESVRPSVLFCLTQCSVERASIFRSSRLRTVLDRFTILSFWVSRKLTVSVSSSVNSRLFFCSPTFQQRDVNPWKSVHNNHCRY